MEDRSASSRRNMDPFGHGLCVSLRRSLNLDDRKSQSGSTFSTIAEIHDAVDHLLSSPGKKRKLKMG